jgi:hypothetical protein
MRSDDVYRFIVLRDPETRTADDKDRSGPDARLVNAYATGGEVSSILAAEVSNLLPESRPFV